MRVMNMSVQCITAQLQIETIEGIKRSMLTIHIILSHLLVVFSVKLITLFSIQSLAKNRNESTKKNKYFFDRKRFSKKIF